MKHPLFLIPFLAILTGNVLSAQAPAELGIIYWEDGTTLQPLAKVPAKIVQAKIISGEISGATAALRLPTGLSPTFRVCGVDPTRYKLYALKSAKNARTVALWTLTKVGREYQRESIPESEIAVTIRAADGNCFSLVPQKPLAVGEYGFSPVDSNDIFAFGVGNLGNSNQNQKLPAANQGSTLTEPSNIAVKSTPAGAEITVDGKFLGSTPSTVRLDPGDHDIMLQKPGFGTWKRTMTVRPGSSVTVDATLEKVSQ